MLKRLSVLVVVALVAIATVAQEMAVSKSAYKKCVYVVGGDSLLYRELVPENAGKKKFPLVVFMHGAGERGSDNELQLTHGAQMFLNPVNRIKYPAYVLFPQCPETEYWAYHPGIKKSSYPDSMPVVKEPSKLLVMVRGLVEKYIAEGKVDADRVYVIGLSMGGMAVFDMAERYSDMWAAAVPICGSINPNRIDKSRKVNFRIFHGDADAVVPVEGSRKAYLRLRELGANVDYVEFPGCTHGSGNPAFNLPDFMEWIFSKRRGK